jgi:hypothetical protein
MVKLNVIKYIISKTQGTFSTHTTGHRTTCIVVVERYKIWDISHHAGTAPRNAPSRIYGLQIKKDLT